MRQKQWGSRAFLCCPSITCPSIYFSFHPLTFVTNPLYFQAMVMMKGLMGRCLNHETALDRIRKRANETEDKLSGLKAWKVGMDKKICYVGDCQEGA